jgi:hypothetical protein
VLSHTFYITSKETENTDLARIFSLFIVLVILLFSSSKATDAMYWFVPSSCEISYIYNINIAGL